MKASRVLLNAFRSARMPVAWACVVLIFVAFAERRVADYALNGAAGVLIQNDEAVDSEELVSKLLVVNDVVIPNAPNTTAVHHERPTLLVSAACSLLVVGRCETRAPPLRRIGT